MNMLDKGLKDKKGSLTSSGTTERGELRHAPTETRKGAISGASKLRRLPNTMPTRLYSSVAAGPSD